MKRKGTVFSGRSACLVGALILMASLVSCSRQAKQEEEEGVATPKGEIMLTSQQIKSAGIEFGHMTRERLSMDIHAKGKLILPPQNLAQVSTVVNGTVEQILVREGAMVAKGAPLLTIISPDLIRLQQEFLETRSRLQMVEQDFKRQEGLAKDKITSDKRLQEVQATYQETKARYNSLQLQLSLLNIPVEGLADGNFQKSAVIKAPIAGSVEKIQVHIGQFLEPSTPLMVLVDKSLLYLEIMVFEKDIPFVQVGQRVTFELANLGGEEYESSVTTIGRTVEESARTVKVLSHFNNTSPFVLPGMFVAAEVHTSEQSVDALPEEAVITDENSAYFFITESPEGSATLNFSKIPVTTGFREDGFVQVTPLKAIPAGARIPVKGTYFIKAQGLKQAE